MARQQVPKVVSAGDGIADLSSASTSANWVTTDAYSAERPGTPADHSAGSVLL